MEEKWRGKEWRRRARLIQHSVFIDVAGDGCLQFAVNSFEFINGRPNSICSLSGRTMGPAHPPAAMLARDATKGLKKPSQRAVEDAEEKERFSNFVSREFIKRKTYASALAAERAKAIFEREVNTVLSFAGKNSRLHSLLPIVSHTHSPKPEIRENVPLRSSVFTETLKTQSFFVSLWRVQLSHCEANRKANISMFPVPHRFGGEKLFTHEFPRNCCSLPDFLGASISADRFIRPSPSPSVSRAAPLPVHAPPFARFSRPIHRK